MKSFLHKIVLLITAFPLSLLATAQEVNRTVNYDPEKNKMIPDKVLEIGLPLLTILLLVNAVTTIVRARAEYRLKEKALDKNLSEPTLIALFSENKALEKNASLRWFLVLLSVAVSFFVLYLIEQVAGVRSGLLATGIICLFLSISFFIYHRMADRD